MGINELKASNLVKSSASAKDDALSDKQRRALVARKVNQDLARFQDEEKADFIEALLFHGNVSRACTLCGISRQSAIQARKRDPLFAAAWHDALESHIDAVEEAMFVRAKDPSPANTVAGIFLLKARRRDQYAERLEVDHNVSGKVDVVVNLVNAPRRADEDVVDAEIVGPGAPDSEDEG